MLWELDEDDELDDDDEEDEEDEEDEDCVAAVDAEGSGVDELELDEDDDGELLELLEDSGDALELEDIVEVMSTCVLDVEGILEVSVLFLARKTSKYGRVNRAGPAARSITGAAVVEDVGSPAETCAMVTLGKSGEGRGKGG